jgi:alcohol dehydrogenase class IV
MIPSFTFSIPTQIQFGPDISLQAGGITKNLAASQERASKAGALVIIDPGIKGTAWVKAILASLQENGLQFLTFD